MTDRTGTVASIASLSRRFKSGNFARDEMNTHAKPIVHDNGEFWNVEIDGIEFTAMKHNPDWVLAGDDNWGALVDAARSVGIAEKDFWQHYKPLLGAAVAEGMSKTEALRKAPIYVSIHGAGTSWIVYGPYRSDDPSGPNTSINYTSYQRAVIGAAGWKAQVVLGLMDRLNDDTMWAVEQMCDDPYGAHNVRSLVNHALTCG